MNGSNPVAVIFAKSATPDQSGQADRRSHRQEYACHMGSFVVFLNDDEKLENQLKELAKRE